MTRTLPILLLTLLVGCSSADLDEASESAPSGGDLDFPSTPPAEGGKTDVFGRSLVGAPSPYTPSAALLGDPAAAEQRLSTNMRLRREQAWETVAKLLEPVPLLGLKNQLEARPSCPEGVSDADLDRCESHEDARTCDAATSGGVSEICAWDAEVERCEPTCDHLTLPDGAPIPTIPRWETWYGVEDIQRIFAYAYGELDEAGRLARAPLSDALIGEAFQANNTAKERSDRWPLRRYTDAVLELFDCPLEQRTGESDEDYAARCAEGRQSQFSGASAAGGGIARMLYSPAMVLHMMRNYGEVLDCRDDALQQTWCGDGVPCEDPEGENFSTCFRAEFPADAGNPWAQMDPQIVGDVAGLPAAGGTVLMKATWARVGFGFDLPAYDTDADALRRRLEPGASALWEPVGDRRYPSPATPDEASYPTPSDIYTIRTASGALYRLTGLHVMTKELRHWQWITLWWSDRPDSDFGADRPASFDALPGVWSNYKMCVVVDYRESDPDVLGRYDDLPSLQAALAATEPVAGAPTWCSNPYIEHEAGNARTNCIGCHQHAGSRFAERLDETGGDELPPFDLAAVIAEPSASLTTTNRYPANGRLRRRTHFAADYSWAFSRLDDLTELVRSEVEYEGADDPRWQRMRAILDGEGSVDAGEAVFRAATAEQTCTDCHGEAGEGGIGPDLHRAFAQKTDWQLLDTVLQGRDPMPAWGERLSDQQLTDLFAYLRATFERR